MQLALDGIRHYTQVFGAPPMPDWKYQPLPAGVTGEDADRLFAARMAMPNEEAVRLLGLTQWTATLERAGVLTEAVRTSRGTQSRASDGHWCRSQFERAVDDFMTANAIAHDVEPAWAHHPTLNPSGARRADWRLADGTFVEAAGLLDDPGYAAKMASKTELATATGQPLLIITPQDLTRLPEVFSAWLRRDVA